MREIIEQNKALVRAIVKKQTGSYNEDIEQEVYIKIWRNLAKYTDAGKFKTWLATIAVNVCRDYFKSSIYRQRQNEVVGDELLENRAVPCRQEKIVDAKVRQKIILQAVNKLPAKMRKVIILFEFEEFTIFEIAKKLGEPEGTIKSRLYNARKILAEELKFLQGEDK